jgi:hypothetical protein
MNVAEAYFSALDIVAPRVTQDPLKSGKAFRYPEV